MDEVCIPETPRINCFWIAQWRSRACVFLHLNFVYFLFDSKSFSVLSKLVFTYRLIISCRNDKWSVSMLSQLSQGGHENHQEGGKYMHTKRRCRYKINALCYKYLQLQLLCGSRNCFTYSITFICDITFPLWVCHTIDNIW